MNKNTEAKPKHTPTPWHIGINPGPMVYGELGEQIADCRGLDESKQNALLIVRAVNAHEDLLKHTKVAVTILRFFDQKRYLDSADQEVLRNLEAAIRKAEEVQP